MRGILSRDLFPGWKNAGSAGVFFRHGRETSPVCGQPHASGRVSVVACLLLIEATPGSYY